jgi:hypothetical protein
MCPDALCNNGRTFPLWVGSAFRIQPTVGNGFTGSMSGTAVACRGLKRERTVVGKRDAAIAKLTAAGAKWIWLVGESGAAGEPHPRHFRAVAWWVPCGGSRVQISKP